MMMTLSPKSPLMTTSDISTVLEKHWYSSPVPIYDIILDMGLKLTLTAMDKKVVGLIRQDNGVYTIVVNTRHSLTRQRFTAAHELGHYIYHNVLVGDGVADNEEYSCEGTPMHNPLIQTIQERQANNFAANVLIPAHSILAGPLTLNVQKLATRFQVAESVMKIRLRRLWRDGYDTI